MNGSKLIAIGSAALVVWIGIAAAGCQPQQPPASVAQPPAQSTAPGAASPPPAVPMQPTQLAVETKPAVETLKVGIQVPLTGPAAFYGPGVEGFTRLGIDDVNAKGGVKVGGKTYRLEAVTVDDKSTADGGREAANRLVLAEKVRFILGSLSSAVAGAQPATESNKVVTLALTATDKSLGPSFPLTLQTGTHILMRSSAIYEWLAKERADVKRIVFVMPDDATGRSTADLSEGIARGKGMTVVAKEFFPTDLKDAAALVASVLRNRPDAIDLGPTGSRGPILVSVTKALNEQGYKGPVIGTSGATSVLRDSASVIGNYTTAVVADWRAPAVGADEKQVIERAVQKYGEAQIDPSTLASYTAAPLLAQAMEKAGTVEDAVKIVGALREGEWDLLWTKAWGKSRFVGAKTFGLPVILQQSVYLSRVQGGTLSTFTAVNGTMP